MHKLLLELSHVNKIPDESNIVVLMIEKQKSKK